MRLRVSRREFVSGLGGITAAAALPGIPGRTFLDWADDLPMDSSNSHSALSPAAGRCPSRGDSRAVRGPGGAPNRWRLTRRKNCKWAARRIVKF